MKDNDNNNKINTENKQKNETKKREIDKRTGRSNPAGQQLAGKPCPAG